MAGASSSSGTSVASAGAASLLPFLSDDLGGHHDTHRLGVLDGLVLELGKWIDEAFTECYISIDEKSHHRESVVLKKLNIMHEAFGNALTRVNATMEKIKI